MTLVGSRQMAVYNDLATEPLRIFDKGVDMPAADEVLSGDADVVSVRGHLLAVRLRR